MSAAANDITAVLLAAGKGVRMQSELPKVLHPLNGTPLIRHVIDSVMAAGIRDIIVVVGYQGQQVIDALDGIPGITVAWQREQLGTGHAVLQAEQVRAGFPGPVLVACGDVPLIRPAHFRSLVDAAREPNARAAVLTMFQDNPTGYGRIMKDARGFIERIVEEKDATPDEKAVREVNSGTYVFDGPLLFEGLKTIGTDNAQREYYLPDVLQHIRRSGYDVRAVLLEDAICGRGINSREELAALEEYLRAHAPQ